MSNITPAKHRLNPQETRAAENRSRLCMSRERLKHIEYWKRDDILQQSVISKDLHLKHKATVFPSLAHSSVEQVKRNALRQHRSPFKAAAVHCIANEGTSEKHLPSTFSTALHKPSKPPTAEQEQRKLEILHIQESKKINTLHVKPLLVDKSTQKHFDDAHNEYNANNKTSSLITATPNAKHITPIKILELLSVLPENNSSTCAENLDIQRNLQSASRAERAPLLQPVPVPSCSDISAKALKRDAERNHDYFSSRHERLAAIQAFLIEKACSSIQDSPIEDSNIFYKYNIYKLKQ